jgi:DNA-binding GntR family transcriptional regulator
LCILVWARHALVQWNRRCAGDGGVISKVLREGSGLSKRRLSAQQIYQRLREMILDFDLFPGARVTEQELADKFKVSRTPVRQALQRLEAEGQVQILPKQGCFIRSVDIETISAHYDVRVALETMAVELACANMSNEDLQALADSWNPDNRPPDMSYEQHVSLVDESFHMRVAAGSGNTVMEDYLKDVNDRIRIIRRLGFPDETSVRETYEEHFAICQLMLKRDVARAREAMIEHIRKSQSIARKVTVSQLEGHRKQHGRQRRIIRRPARP